MTRVYYWRDVIGDEQLFSPYEDEIERLLLGEYSSLSLERLNGVTNPPIYSIRTNRETRILFTTYQGKVCLLDVVEHHDYHKNRFLRDKRVLKAFLNRLDEVEEIESADASFVDVTEIEALSPTDESSASGMTALDYYQRRLIQLNGNQQKVLQASLPVMVYGPAGSGKSCVALTMLMDYVRSHREEDDAFPVVYVTQSRPLLEEMKRLWQEAGGLTEAVSFKTYTELQQAQLGLDGSITDDELFTTWYEGWSAHYQKRQRLSSGTFLQPLSSETVWREFRIHSGYDLDAYMQLGARQSELDAASRKIVGEAYAAYMAYLAEHHWASPELHPLVSGDYRLVVVDEAQDFSYGQLKGLNQLAKGSVVYFLGDHQVLFDGKSRWFYLQELFRAEGLTPAEIALPTTYRCCERVIQVANELIQLKYQVTGGHADGVESSQLTMAPDVAGVVGESSWLSPHATDLAGLQAEASSAKFAVVAWPEHLSEAQELFRTPLIFTPKEIKGLEYDTVVIWCPLDMEEARRASQKLLHAKPGARQHRAKAGEADESLLPYFNELITAVTRARFRVVIVQDKRHAIEVLAEALQKATQPVSPVVLEASCSGGASGGALDVSEWEEEARRLLRNEDIARARQIFTETLRRTELDFQAFMTADQTKTASAPSLAAGAAVPSRNDKNHKRQKESSKSQEIASVPSPVLTGPKLALKLIEEKSPRLTPEIQAALCQDGENGIEKTFLYHLVMRPKGAEILSKLLHAHRELVNVIPHTAWGKTVQISALTNTSPLYWLTKHKEGLPLISLLVEHYPEIILAIPAETWGLARPKIAGVDANTTPIYWLAATLAGEHILQKLIENYGALVRAIPREAWSLARPEEIGEEGCLTPFYCLATDSIGCGVLTSLIERFPEIIQSIPGSVWALSRTEASGDQAYLTPLSVLLLHSHGRTFFYWLMSHYPAVIKSIPEKAWSFSLSGDASLAPLYSMAGRGDENCILRKLFKSYPEIVQAIPIDAWSFAVSVGEDVNVTPLYWLAANADEDDSSLLFLIKNHPKIIASISSAAWGLARPKEAGEYAGFSPLYWLMTFDNFHVFKLLIKRYPQVIEAIPAKAWNLMIPKTAIKEHAHSSPLSRLLMSADGRCTLLDLITFCPKVIEKIPASAWTSMIKINQSRRGVQVSSLSLLACDLNGKRILLRLKAYHECIEDAESVKLTRQISQLLQTIVSESRVREGLSTQGIFSAPDHLASDVDEVASDFAHK